MVLPSKSKEMADQWQAAREGRKQKMFEHRRPFSRTLVRGIGF